MTIPAASINTKNLTPTFDPQTSIHPVFQFSSLKDPTIENQMAYFGHPILRRQADPIPYINQDILELIDFMKQSLLYQKGLGIAAPQIGVSLSIFITCFPNLTTNGKTISLQPPKVFINPIVSDPSAELFETRDGCLSIPELIGKKTTRPKTVTVSYYDETGTYYTEQFTDWPAKVILHESDHLKGVLFIDHLSPKDQEEIKKTLNDIENTYRTHNEHLATWPVCT